ncbi:MAG: baseplate J/gp47 family protein [Campylobacterota bacterium]|nr:baseplate J/gp47 family protein [Campylobacterota bacterium]
MLQNIKLDDRTYEQIRDEAVSNIIKHCPQWTNHNSSDPGITLIELFSSMTEMTLYRLNQVPQKNYIAFLDLIGIKQRLPIPSVTNVTFKLSDGYQMDMEKKNTILLQKGSVVTTEPQAQEDAVVFETARDLYMSNVKLLNLYSKKFNLNRNRDEIINHSEDVANNKSFQPFVTDEKTTNSVEIYLASDDFNVLQNDVKATLMFRLPTTMREYKISEDFMKNMKWQYFDGFNWIDLNIAPNYKLVIDTKDADVLVVTIEGNNSEFISSSIEKFSEDEKFYLKGIFTDIRPWLSKFMVYEVSMVASSDENGIFPNICFHNYEQVDLNNEFYPFGSRPKIDNPMQDEVFLIKSDEAFGVPGSMVSLEILHSINSEYKMAKGSMNLQIVWEYPVGISKWSLLEVEDTTDNFTNNGNIVFKVPKDIAKIALNGEEGFWVRARISAGDFGSEEQSEYDEQSGDVKVTPSTLRPPLFNKVLIHYTLTRKDLKDCYIFNNFKYNSITFDKNRPVHLFEENYSHEEAIVFGFDTYLSDDYLDIYFDLEDKIIANQNIYTNQRLIEWELFQNESWKPIECEDFTDGLTRSGYVRIKLPLVEKLESMTVYVDQLKRLWLKARTKFSSLNYSPKINRIMLNTVDVIQKETYEDEFIARSVGLPNMKFKLNYKNLVAPPVIFVGDDEYKAVDRFIDFGKEDKVFRFNGITGEIEFGDGQYGVVPELGLNIVAKEYSITQGAAGNIPKDNLKVLRESINYIDSLSNPFNCKSGENGDTLDDLKRYAPSVLKTMERAVNIEDYKLLSENFSPFIKKAYCVNKNGEVVIIILTEDILETEGFINVYLLKELEEYLKERSLITVNPIVRAPKIVNVRIFLKLKYTLENYSFIENELKAQLLKKAKEYFDPFEGFNSKGYPLGREISKGDLHNIINSADNTFYMSEMRFQKSGSSEFEERLKFSHNDMIKINDVIIEDISYDI